MSDKKRILIVDDEPDFTFMMGLNLEQTGRFETRAENSALQAVATAREYDPALILLDVMMPDADGGDVLAALRDDPATRTTPVIFLTALVGGGEVPPGGGQAFMPKPVNLPALLRRMDELIEHAAAAAAPVGDEDDDA